jgi:alpha-tubulin suppressor-like RCC1 family protein
VREASNGTWKAVSAGGSHTCAIRSDSLLFCWGLNQNSFGNGGTTNSSVPTQSNLDNWVSVSAGTRGTEALRAGS